MPQGLGAILADHDDTALTYAELARQEKCQLPLDESPSLMPQAAFDDAELVEKPPSDHESDV